MKDLGSFRGRMEIWEPTVERNGDLGTHGRAEDALHPSPAPRDQAP